MTQYEQGLLIEMYETVTNSQYTLYNVLCNIITVNYHRVTKITILEILTQAHAGKDHCAHGNYKMRNSGTSKFLL